MPLLQQLRFALLLLNVAVCVPSRCWNQAEQEGGLDHNVVNCLLAGGGSVNEVNEHGFSALMFAAMNNLKNVALKLVGRGALLDLQSHSGETALILSIRGGFNATLSLSKQPVITSPTLGYFGTAKYLIDQGASMNLCTERGETALLTAVSGGRKDIVDALVAAGAGLNLHDDQGVYSLANNGNECMPR